jgi:hypothetical protein
LSIRLGNSHDLQIRTVKILLEESAHVSVDEAGDADAKRESRGGFRWRRLRRSIRLRRKRHGCANR